MPLSSPAPQSVERIFAILGHLTHAPDGGTLTALAQHADAPKSSVVGLLSGMVGGGYVARDSQGRYRLGPAMMVLATDVVTRHGLRELARPVLKELAEQTGETAMIGALAPDADLVMYLDKVESSNPVRYTIPLGERRALYASAVGKVLLAHMPAERRDRYLRRQDLQPFTPKTITSVRKLRSVLAKIRSDGASLTCDERVVGVSAIACPVFGPGGDVAAALVIAGPSERIRSRTAQHRARLIAGAKSLSLMMAGARTAQDRP